MGKLSRTKGHDWERETAIRLTQATGVKCRRCLTETQQGNQGDIASDLPFVFQCKIGKNVAPVTALQEAQEVAERLSKEETPHARVIPVAIIKKNGRPGGGRPPVEMAVVPLDWFYEVLGRLYGQG